MSEDARLNDSRRPLSAGTFLYAILAISSALFTVTGTYRSVVGFLTSLPIPEAVVSSLAGMLQLVWSDLAYCIAKPLGSVGLFVMIPYLGAACSSCSAFLLLLRNRTALKLVTVNLIAGILAALASIAVLIMRGGHDGWRIVAVSSFLVENILWLVYFKYSDRGPSRVESTNRL